MNWQTLRADRLGYVALKTTDLDKSLAFWTEAVQLEVSEKRDDKAFLRGGMQHHWIALHQAEEPGLARIGIEVADRETLARFENELSGAGVTVETGSALKEDHIVEYLRFDDPSGNPLELYADMVAMATPPRPISVNILEIQHAVLNIEHLGNTEEFYTGLLGMRVSDYIGKMMFFAHFRNGWHHGMGFAMTPGQTSGFHHVCFQPPDLDNVMRARARVKKLGYEITLDLLRHGPSGSVGFYFLGPDGVAEMSYGARLFGEEELFNPRQLSMSPATIDVWQTGLDDEGASAADGLKSLGGNK